MKRNAFSLMEMMVVMLIVAIVAAATAPMISKKMLSAESGLSPWVLTGNHLYFPLMTTPVVIGGNTSPAATPASLFLYNSNDPQLAIGTAAANNLVFFHYKGGLKIGDSSSEASDTDSIAIGFNSVARGDDAVAIGKDTESTGSAGSNGGTVAIGFKTKATGSNGVAIGPNTEATTNDDILAIGNSATVSGAGAVALGSFISNTAASTIAIGISAGGSSNTMGSSAIAIGEHSSSTGTGSIAIGGKVGDDIATAQYDRAIAIGVDSNALGSNSIAIGTDIHTGAVSNAVAMGNNGTTASGASSIAFGNNATSGNTNAVAIGTNSEASAENSIAIGNNAKALSSGSVAIGNGATTLAGAGSNVVVLGNAESNVIIPGHLIVGKTAAIGRDITDNALKIRSKRYNNPSSTIFDFIKEVEQDGYSSNLQISDKRLKDVGDKFKGGLEELKKLDLYHYTFKKDKNKKPMVGVMAQDLQKVFPNAVITGDDGFLRIRWDEIFYSLVNAVKELDNKIAALATQVKTVVGDVAQVKTKQTETDKTVAEMNNIISELVKENKEQQKTIKALEQRLAKLESKK